MDGVLAVSGTTSICSMLISCQVMIGGVIYAYVVEGPKRGAESQLQETVDLIFSSTMFILFGVGMSFVDGTRPSDFISSNTI